MIIPVWAEHNLIVKWWFFYFIVLSVFISWYSLWKRFLFLSSIYLSIYLNINSWISILLNGLFSIIYFEAQISILASRILVKMAMSFFIILWVLPHFLAQILVSCYNFCAPAPESAILPRNLSSFPFLFFFFKVMGNNT